ncbi:MAG TPA: hypothetical protein ENI31_07225 [Candidatus Omnitrophica bacterium]|nr:hypothetical protein [Candidatus Omnitrophota bacterium]
MSQDLNKFLEKVSQEKLKEREIILKEAETKKDEILSRLREQAKNYFANFKEKEKSKILREVEEALFKAKLEKKKLILQERESLKEEALDRLRKYLSENKNLIPKKKIVSSAGEEQVQLELEEFLELVRKKAQKELDRILNEEI